MSNKLTSMAKELLIIEEDLPFRFDYIDRTRKEFPNIDDFELYTFEQTWGSTALGFGGISGQAITTAQTYVFVPVGVDQKCFVYFAGRFAYAVEYSKKFMEDVMKHNVAAKYEAGKYRIRK